MERQKVKRRGENYASTLKVEGVALREGKEGKEIGDDRHTPTSKRENFEARDKNKDSPMWKMSQKT